VTRIPTTRIPRVLRWVLAAVVALVVAVPLATAVYINVIREDAPERLTLAREGDVPTSQPAEPGSLSGTYRPTSASEVGYRVKEILFGQRAEAVGRTSEVAGTLTIEGTTVQGVSLSVDMTSVRSDESRRDGQFQGRIMETSQFPTATFELAEPIDLGSVPPAGKVVTAEATGTLTLHGVAKQVVFALQAQRDGASIKVNGSLPVLFADYEIDNPSFGGITTEDHGELEFLVVFAR
jgi:polyisoprenoid-binding protein YceI